MRIDSSEAKALALNTQVSARNKHNEFKYHFVEAVLSSKILVSKDIRSANSTAELLTKVLIVPTTFLSSQKIHFIRD